MEYLYIKENNYERMKKHIFIYKINELTWLKDRFELFIQPKLTDEDVQKYLDELTKSVNNIHEILNNIRK